MPPVALSVVVPVKDGAAHLPALLAALREQQVTGGFEVVALDSGSRDGSREMLAGPRGFALRPIDVAPAAFDHGTTRNLGAREARGTFLVFLSQDALPIGPRFLETLVEPLRQDLRLAGVSARQRPRPDADAITRERLARGGLAETRARRVFATAAELDAMSALERLRACTFDNVAASVRRDVLLAHPFPASRFGEDVEWADRILRAGFGLAVEPAAEVVHSHQRNMSALFRRRYLEHRTLMRVFGVAVVPSVSGLLRAAVGGALHDLAVAWRAREPGRALIRAPWQAIAEACGEYRGARDERHGRPYPRWA